MRAPHLPPPERAGPHLPPCLCQRVRQSHTQWGAWVLGLPQSMEGSRTATSSPVPACSPHRCQRTPPSTSPPGVRARAWAHAAGFGSLLPKYQLGTLPRVPHRRNKEVITVHLPRGGSAKTGELVHRRPSGPGARKASARVAGILLHHGTRQACGSNVRGGTRPPVELWAPEQLSWPPGASFHFCKEKLEPTITRTPQPHPAPVPLDPAGVYRALGTARSRPPACPARRSHHVLPRGPLDGVVHLVLTSPPFLPSLHSQGIPSKAGVPNPPTADQLSVGC